MGIQNGTILDGGTTSTTGGTSKTLSVDGQKVNNGLHVTDLSVTDGRIRPGIWFSVKMPAYNNAQNVWTRGRKEAKLDFPKILASGIIEFPGVRIIVSDHPEQTDAEVTKMLNWGAQLLSDPDFVAFFKQGSVA
jgi:hypothetical protein